MSVEILVNNKPITVYTSNGKNYVEGRNNSEFEIKITNPFPYKVLAVPSVDGISIIDGKPASAESSGYILHSRETITIPGWKVDNNTSAKFTFTLKEKSYAAVGEVKDTSNTGVIGVMFFNEKKNEVYNNSILRGISTLPLNGNPFDDIANKPFTLCASSYVEPEQELGTAFGKATDFKVKEVEFKRGDLLSTTVIFYDSKSNLVKRGIIKQTVIRQEPNPFPGVGCKIPKGWSK